VWRGFILTTTSSKLSNNFPATLILFCSFHTQCLVLSLPFFPHPKHRNFTIQSCTPNANHARVSIQALQGNSDPRTRPLQPLAIQLHTRRELSLPSTRHLRGFERLQRCCLVGGPARGVVRRRDCRSSREFKL